MGNAAAWGRIRMHVYVLVAGTHAHAHAHAHTHTHTHTHTHKREHMHRDKHSHACTPLHPPRLLQGLAHATAFSESVSIILGPIHTNQ